AALFKEGPRRLPADARAQPGDVRGPVFAAFRRIPRGPVVGPGLSGDIGSPRTGLSEGAPRGVLAEQGGCSWARPLRWRVIRTWPPHRASGKGGAGRSHWGARSVPRALPGLGY